MSIAERIQSYLCNGGFFNPECMEHDKVRGLIMDVQTQLSPRPMYEAPKRGKILAFVPARGQWHVVEWDCHWHRWTTGGHDGCVPAPSHWLPVPPSPYQPSEIIPGIFV